jgi:hypothetical protein
MACLTLAHYQLHAVSVLFFSFPPEPQIKSLDAQNQILKKNISVLFKTAQVELERKGEEIKQLRKRCGLLFDGLVLRR